MKYLCVMDTKSLFMSDSSEGDCRKEGVMDFVLSWTLRRAQSEFKNEKPLLYAACRRILFGLLEITDYDQVEVDRVETRKQWKRTDMFAEIMLRYPSGKSEKYAVLIENKLYTHTHDRQLERYKQTFFDKYAESEFSGHLLCVLITCYGEPPADMVADCKANGFRCLPIEDLQPVVPEEDTESDIFNEFWLRNW